MLSIRYFQASDGGTGAATKLATDHLVSVGQLKEEISKQSKLRIKEICLVHCGKPLVDTTELRDIPTLRLPNATVFVFIKPQPKPIEAVPTVEMESLLTSMQVALQDRNARATLFRISGDVEVLSNLVATIPQLKNDLVAQAVVKDPFLLIHWLSPPNVRKTLAEHPALFDAAQQLLAIVHTEASKPGQQPGMFVADDDDDSDASGPSNRQPTRNAAAPGRSAISADQLAMALAAAAGNVNPAGSSNSSTAAASSRPPVASTARPAINADFLQRAIAAASAPPANVVNESHLSQLRDMGFTDDAENRKALAATSGNVEAALEWIISQRERIDEMD